MLSLTKLFSILDGINLLAPIYEVNHSFLGNLVLAAYVNAAVLILVISGHIKFASCCATVKAALFNYVLINFSLELDSQKVVS